MQDDDDLKVVLHDPSEQARDALDGKPEGEPTAETYDDLVAAYRYFNEHLFAGELFTPVLITLRARHTLGIFNELQLENAANGRTAHEIALNPEEFTIHNELQVLSTLARMMVQQLMFQRRTRGRRGYINRATADAMAAIGLPTQNASQPELDTGDCCLHTIVQDGPFDRVARAFLASLETENRRFRARWADRFPSQGAVDRALVEARRQRTDTVAGEAPLHKPGQPVFQIRSAKPPTEKDAPTKIKYQCPVCGNNVWGRPGIPLVCGDDWVALRQMNLPDGAQQRVPDPPKHLRPLNRVPVPATEPPKPGPRRKARRRHYDVDPLG